MFRAYKYGPDYPGLAGKDLKPGKTVEELQPKEAETKKGSERTKGAGATMSPARKFSRLLLLAVLLVLLMPGQAPAYIGPGAGFALAGSFFAVFAAVGSALLTFITWPVRL